MRGGKREKAGRPKGSTRKEATTVMRVPQSQVLAIKRMITERMDYKLPLYSYAVPAGFPSPADDYIESFLDLNEHLIARPASTFFLKASGDSMINVGIHDGDLLIVDRSLKARHGKIVIAAINGELTVKRFSNQDGKIRLLPANPDYPPIDIPEEGELFIWGVVIHTIHSRF